MERWLTSNPWSSLFLSEGTRKNRHLQTLLIPGDGGNDSYSLPSPPDIESPKFKSWGGKIKFMTLHQNNLMLKQLQLFGSGRLRGLWPSPEFSRVLFAPQTQDIFPNKEMYVFIEKCNSHCNYKHSNMERNAFPIHINSGVNLGMLFCPFKWQCHELHNWGELFQWRDLYPLSHWGQRPITSEKETKRAHQLVGMRGHSSQWDATWRLTGMGKSSSWFYGSCNILQEMPWLGVTVLPLCWLHVARIV